MISRRKSAIMVALFAGTLMYGVMESFITPSQTTKPVSNKHRGINLWLLPDLLIPLKYRIKQLISTDAEDSEDYPAETPPPSREAHLNQTISRIANLTRLPEKEDIISRVKKVLLTLPKIPSVPLKALKKARKSELAPMIPPKTRVTYRFTWKGYTLPVLTNAPSGRLGNVMGEYATLYAAQKIYNVTVFMRSDMREQLNHFPNLSIPDLPVPFDPKEWQSVGYYGDVMSVNYSPIQLAAAGLLGPHLFVTDGYSFEIQLFHTYREELRKEFTFSKTLTDEVHKFFKNVTRARQREGFTENVFIGLHIRRTDYFEQVTRFGGKMPGDYYIFRAMDYYRTKYSKSAVFIAASDDAKYIHEKFANDSDVFFAPGTSGWLDMAVLSSCNHSLVTVGSYGFFCGYLTGGEVVYPANNYTRGYSFSKKTYENVGMASFTPIPVE